MDGEHRSVDFHRHRRLVEAFRDKEFRDTYVAAHTRRFLARQMRKFRGGTSQTEFANLLDKQQTIVSRLENPNYSGWTLGTLFEIASKLNVGVFVRFVDFTTFLKYTDDQSEGAMRPAEYDQQKVDDFARLEAAREITEADILRALEILRPKENAEVKEAAKEAAKEAQKESVERGLYHPERPERPPLRHGPWGAGAAPGGVPLV